MGTEPGRQAFPPLLHEVAGQTRFLAIVADPVRLMVAFMLDQPLPFAAPASA